MIVVQLGASSRIAWMLLLAFAGSSAAFGLLWSLRRDPVAAVFAMLSLLGAVRLGVTLSRRRGFEAAADTVSAGRASAIHPSGTPFATFARVTNGGFVRHGVVLIGPRSAVFVPMGRRSPIALELLSAPFVARFRFVDLGLDLRAVADLDAALIELSARRDGFVIDESWTYHPAQRWLYRPGDVGVVGLEAAPPSLLHARWRVPPALTLAEFQRLRDRLAVIVTLVVLALVLVGVFAWRLSGELDFLVAAIAWGVLIGCSAIAGVVTARRRFGL